MLAEASPIWFVMMFVLLLPVLFVGLIGLAIYAIAKNRPGIVAAIGGGLLLLMVSGVLFAFVGVPTARHTSNAHLHISPTSIDANFTPVNLGSGQSFSSGRISWVGIMFVIALSFALIIAFRRHSGSNRVNGQRGAGPGWAAAILGVLAVAFLGLLTAKRFAAQQYYQAGQQQAIALQTAAMQQMVAHQQAEAEQPTSEFDIDELMDKVDAPKIPLPPIAPTAPAPPEASVPASENGNVNIQASVETTTKSEKSNDVKSAKNESRRKNGKSTSSNATRPQAEADSPDKSVVAAPPNWVNESPKRVGETEREVIATDEYVTADECYEARDIYLLLKTYERLQRLLGAPYHHYTLPSLYHGEYIGRSSDGVRVMRNGVDPGQWIFDDSAQPVWDDPRLQELRAMGIGVDYVQREVAKQDYLDTVERSFGPMKKLYTQIEFAQSVDNDLRRCWTNYERTSRLASVGFGAGGIMGLLGFVYGLLKVDTWTKGYYSKRLFLGVPAAIIGLVMLCALIFGP